MLGGFIMNREQFLDALKQIEVEIDDFQMEQFLIYQKLLTEWNQKMNLTAITDLEGVFLKHFYDSLLAVKYFDFNQQPFNIIDVGAGAGFPSFPIKIVFPHLLISIVDSLNKRITFLEALSKELQLKQVSLFHDRAESFAQNKLHRENYDIAMARAVARLNVLSELCLPLVKKGGHFIALKGSQGKEELSEANKAIKLLGGTNVNIYQDSLPAEEGERNIIIIKKDNTTPKKYPRKIGIPNKQPIT